jgi:hypothetical protein
MSILLQNKLLAAVEKKVESQLTPRVRGPYMRVVVAGMKVGLHKGKDSIIASLEKSKDPVKDCVEGAVNIVTVLQKESRGTLDFHAMVPGAMTLMLKALDFAAKARIIKVDKKVVDRATLMFADLVYERMGITPEMIQKASYSAQAAANDPRMARKIEEQAGRAVTPGAKVVPRPPMTGGDNGV